MRSIFLTLLGLFAATHIATASAQDDAQTVLHLLDYIAVDYAEAVENGKVKKDDEYREMSEFAAQVQRSIKGLAQNPAREQLLDDSSALIARIAAKAPPAEVAGKATALRWALIHAYQVQVTPKRAPDLELGASLYEKNCVTCHGAQGRGDGPAGKGLDPAPSNFHDAERMAQRSAYGLYNTITLGVNGTGMASYQKLSEQERWALAFFVANFIADDKARADGAALWTAGAGRKEFPDIANVATLSANEVAQRFGKDAVAMQKYLLAQPEALDAVRPAPLDFAIATLSKSLQAYRRGAVVDAAQLAVQAYLEGFELVESSLRNVDAELMTQTERAMMTYRSTIQSSAPIAQVEAQASETIALLNQARAKLSDVQISPTTTFISALVILLREGAEAILVVAAILAFLARTGRSDARRWVHAGWVAALAFGAVTWVISSHVVEISGASREITEGVTALIAAVMLLYVGYWLHSKSNSIAWQKFISEQVGGALSKGTVWTLALVSFLAVYREAFETVLFYQALATQAGAEGHGALLGGLVLAAVLLIAIAWVILRASVELPVNLFFSISGAVLVVLAVVFTGQGVAALQEAGRVAVDTIGTVRIPMLGIYPTVQTLVAQAAMIGVIVFGLWWVGRKTQIVTDDAQQDHG